MTPALSQTSTIGNLSLKKLATSSSVQGPEMDTHFANDGDSSTRFSSAFSDDEWLTIDLIKPCQIKSIVLVWERAYGKDFNILFSNNGSFTDLKYDSIQVRNNVLSNNNIAGTNSLIAKPKTVARYVRMQGIHRATNYGYSLWEFKIMGSPLLNSGALPVSIKNFSASADNSNASINWSTVTEYNIDGYFVQKSTDGLNFTSIYWVAALDNGSNVSNYTYTDNSIKDNASFYRLKVVTFDKDSAYSPVIVFRTSISTSVRIFPMPIQDQIMLDYKGAEGENIKVSVMNTSGLSMYNKTITVTSSLQHISIPRSANMKTGIYILVIESGKNLICTKQLILQ
jgi:hypothetical protein